ncbi:acetylornithine transaminase [Enterococcus sp. JM9B]|uniref:acetylornithine transaminase n=1 Tax=Enterococcus sp. JM9B TaxID=1857216 RepID=UPI0013752760|nr:acetylornithine transaminase [Enterococcus sp. JM9B]KAF1300808.1 acetylornithine transaminase [Enterococcus sp. JM9B]
MSHLFPNYARKPFELVSGTGCYLTDHQGNRYLDFTSGIGVVNLGYSNVASEEALIRQMQLLMHTPNLYENHLQEQVATSLGKTDYLAYFCNSGAEAVEAAIKLARKATQRTKIISFIQSFHGRTYGAMSATGQAIVQQGFAPLVPDFVYVEYNALEGLEEQLDENTAAVILEVIQGEGGVILGSKEWLQEVARLCQKNNSLLIIDEIQTGMGRTGSLYGFEQLGVAPDIFTLAKGLGNGFPVGAMLGKRELASAFGPGSHGSTFGGNKMAMAVAAEVVRQIDQPEFLAEVRKKGAYLFDRLQEISSKKIKEIRGRGLMIGIELQENHSLQKIMKDLEKEGLLTLKAGQNVLRLLPPLTISLEEIDEGIEKLKKVLSN